MVRRLIWICRISCWCSFFPDSDWKYPLWANFVQNIKIVILSWNLVPRLIWIRRIQWCVLFTFSVFDWEYPFGANIILEAEVWCLGILNMQNSCRSLFSNFDRYTLFGQIWSKKSILPNLAEICYQDWFKYVEFISDVHFFSFRLEILCRTNLDKKIKLSV